MTSALVPSGTCTGSLIVSFSTPYQWFSATRPDYFTSLQCDAARSSCSRVVLDGCSGLIRPAALPCQLRGANQRHIRKIRPVPRRVARQKREAGELSVSSDEEVRQRPFTRTAAVPVFAVRCGSDSGRFKWQRLFLHRGLRQPAIDPRPVEVERG